jgi:hypothetical protein
MLGENRGVVMSDLKRQLKEEADSWRENAADKLERAEAAEASAAEYRADVQHANERAKWYEKIAATVAETDEAVIAEFDDALERVREFDPKGVSIVVSWVALTTGKEPIKPVAQDYCRRFVREARRLLRSEARQRRR